MTEFEVQMENRPGRLATLTEALAGFGVNIEALAAYGTNGEGTVRLIVDDAPTTRRVLEEAALNPRSTWCSPPTSPIVPGSWPA